MKIIYTTCEAWPITLATDDGAFTVTYFKQVRSGLTYAEACTELGQCILHALTCDGLTDDVPATDDE